MKALDTNVVIRFLMEDDKAQAAQARETLRRPVYLPSTVLLETIWVLRSHYRLGRRDVADMILNLLDYDTTTVERPALLRWAVERFATRGDPADLIHIVAAQGMEAFVTFDRDIALAAGEESPVPIETLA